MTILLALWSWITSHSPREIATAAAVLALGLFCVYEINHQRNIGYDECKAADAKATASAQAAADKAAATANATIDALRAKTQSKLPDLLQIYNDRTKVADCPPYVRPGPKP
jgi:hypothetical protein